MPRDATRTLFLNVGHFFDHMFMLLFTTVVIALEREFGASYGTLLAFSTAGSSPGQIRTWLHAENGLMGDERAVDLIYHNNTERVLEAIERLETGGFL